MKPNHFEMTLESFIGKNVCVSARPKRKIKYSFHRLRSEDPQMYHRLRWQEYKQRLDRTRYFRERWKKEHNQGINSTDAARARKHRGKRCEVCSSTNNLVAHHRNGNQQDNTKENILTVCFPCHNRIHHGGGSKN